MAYEPTSTISWDEDETPECGTLDTPLSPIPTYVYDTQLLGAIPKHVKSASSTERIMNSSSLIKSNKTDGRYMGASSNRWRAKPYPCPV